MYFGASITFLALGAILALAVQDRLGGVDLVAVGYICVAAGALGIVLSLILNAQRDRVTRSDELPPR